MTDTVAEFIRARIADERRQFEVPDFEEEDSARGPGWGHRTCGVCGDEGWSGTDPVTEDAWHEHAERMHDRPARLAALNAYENILKRETNVKIIRLGAPPFNPSLLAWTRRGWSQDPLDPALQEWMDMYTVPVTDSPTLRDLARIWPAHPDLPTECHR